MAEQLNVVALYRHRSLNHKLHYALAVRLRASGEVDVLLPQEPEWTPYATAGPRLGRLFTEERRHRGREVRQSRLNMNPGQLAQFAAQVVTAPHQTPTLILIEAEGWRNKGNPSGWEQLKNDKLATQRDVLDFNHIPDQGLYKRTDEELANLLGIIRLRTNDETPQYVPVAAPDQFARDLKPLSGFMDRSVDNLWHYYSIGRASVTQKTDENVAVRGLYKLEARGEEYGASTAFRHQQVVEMVPFFVRSDLQHEPGILALSRVPHYLRASPAWATGNTLRPFPLHLAKCLVEDYLCILEV